jgi:hypothetical protein
MIRRTVVVLCAAAWGAAHASPIPLNDAALARGFALPALGQPGIAEPGRLAQQFGLDLVNEFFLGQAQNEQLEIDGEAMRFAWRGHYGIAPGWDIGMTVPFYIAGGGFLDGSIEGWHRFFNLPNANRSDRGHNRFRYQYDRNGQTLLEVSDSGSGLGDVRLEAGRAIGEWLALRAQVKLPTGSVSHLLGNKAWGGALWADFPFPFATGSRFDGFLSAGLSYTAEGDVLPQLQKQFVPFAAVGLEYRLLGNLGAAVQFAVHGALYENTDFAPLARMGAPLSFGLNYRLSPGTKIEVLIQEDAAIYASPDFVLHFAVSMF